jgi:TonB family protein
MQDKRQRPDMPFARRRRDIGTVVYDHSAGIFSVIILFLAFAILFIGARVVIRIPKHSDRIVLDMSTVEELQQEQERLEREVRMRQASAADSGPVSNAISNENADLGDDRNTDMAALRGSAGGLGGSMQSNREAWEQGMREIEAMKIRSGGGSENAGNDTRAKGRVLVSFSLANPVRQSADLVIPGYRCESGGEVVVQITVNRSGDVVAATVDRSLSANDACMHETALDAALRSRFNVDGSAPERQSGTITYMFVPQ